PETVRRAVGRRQDRRPGHARARRASGRDAHGGARRRQGGRVIGPRGMKIVRDLAGRPGRSLLAMVALAAGVFEIGAMLYKYALPAPDLTPRYARTSPSSATLLTDDAGDSLVAAVRRVPGVGAAEARPVVMARARVGDDWMPALLYVVRDFDHQALDTF